MNCRQFEKWIEDYLDGTAGADLQEAIERHRLTCPACASLVKAHRVVLESLGAAERVEAPEGLAERIMSATSEEYRLRKWAFSRRGIVRDIAAAGVFLIGFLIVLVRVLPSGFTLVEGASGRLFAAPLLAERLIGGFFGRLFGTGTADRLHTILQETYHMAFQPLQIPYLAVTVPVYLLVMSVVLVAVVWSYLNSTDLSWNV